MLRLSFPQHVSAIILLIGMASALSLLPTRVAQAQTGSAPTNSALPPADVQKILNEVGDLDILKALTPLKLTADQIEKLRGILNAVAATGEAKRKEDYDAFRALADDISKARTEALAGGDISKELEQRVLKAFTDSAKRFDDTKKDAVNRVYGVLKPLLTEAQKDQIDQQVVKILGGKRLVPREYQKDPKSAPKEALQDLSLSFYIERILLYDRSRDLLAKIKPAEPAAAPAAGAGAAPPEQKP